MFQKMGDAILLGPFMAATNPHPDTNCSGFHTRHMFGYYPKSIR
jgi:hypothetical protein